MPDHSDAPPRSAASAEPHGTGGPTNAPTSALTADGPTDGATTSAAPSASAVTTDATEPRASRASGGHPSLVEVIARGILDSELAALAWVLIEGNVPVVVAVPPGREGAGGQLLAGLLASIRPEVPLESVAGSLTAAGASGLIRGRRPGGVIEAASLGEVRERLGGGPLPLSPDQLTFLGCVLVLGESSGDTNAGPKAGTSAVTGAGAGTGKGRLRVVAAHYVRPLARDAHGHSQRLDPAVLATWDSRLQRYEHFAWGVIPEIASRLGRRAGDLEADLHHRRDDLAGLAKAGVTSLDEVQRLIAGYKVRYGGAHGEGHGSAPS